MNGGGYFRVSIGEVLIFMGLNCENCGYSHDCRYCRILWDASILLQISKADAEKIGITPPQVKPICKLKNDTYVHKQGRQGTDSIIM